VLRQSERAPGLLLGEGVQLPDSVLIGGNVVIHPGTVIGDGVRIQDAAVLGKPPALGRHSTASREPVPPLELGEEATIGAGAVIAAGTRVGRGALVGDHAFVRERSAIGEASVVGAAANVDNDVTIGARVKIQTGCYITAFTTIEDDVFVAPCVTTTNDNAMGRHGPELPLRGAVLRRACRVGAGSILLPGIEVGEEAFVAAGALVTRDVPARTLVMGVPAKPVREVADDELLERWR
jgi:UDP-2-acetamido-3-amino-2,3-dideoxy-glucuronate N-acetyltransferase